MNRYTINSPNSLSNLIGDLRELFKTTKYFTVSISTGKKRTIPQNAVSHAWYNQVSVEEREYTPEDIKCLVKLHFGLPILRGDDPEYNDMCARLIDPLSYEDKLLAMKVYPCTSLMKTKQINLFLEHVQAHYASRVDLQFPEDNV